MKQKSLLNAILIVAGMGVIISGYSLASHYSLASTKFCSLSETINCDLVNKSSYAEIGGIPVALMGVIGYLFLLVAAFMKKRHLRDVSLSLFLVVTSAFAFLFSLYLTGIEAFVLLAWCLLCLASQAVIFVILLASLWEYRLSKKR